MFKKKYYVQQLDEADCGAAALSMILRFHGTYTSIAKIKSYSQTDKDGTTALGLVIGAKHFGLQSRAVRMDMDLLVNEEKNDISFPFIAHVDKDSGLLHYMVVLEAKKGYVLAADPDPSNKFVKMTYKEFSSIWTGIAIFMYPSENYVPTKENDDSLWKTFKILFKHTNVVVTIILATFLSTLITISSAFFLQKIVDSFVVNSSVSTLGIVAGSLFLAYLFHGFFTYIQGFLATILGQRLSIDILLRYIRHLFGLPVSFFEVRKTGEITSRFSDASNIISTLSKTAISTVLNAGTIVMIGIVLAFISFKLFLIAMIAIPAYFLIMLLFYKTFERLNNSVMEENALLSSQIIEDIHGIVSIKSMGVEQKLYKRLDSKFIDTLKAGYKYSLATVIQNTMKDITELIITLGILYFGALMAIRGQITLGQLIAFNSLMGYFLGPVEAVVNLQGDLQNAKVANSRLNQVLLSPVEEENDKLLLHNSDSIDSIVLSNVSFEYKYGQKILKGISLNIPCHKVTAIVGLSGSGKTTLAKLLVNFYAPITGKIEINGQDISELDKNSLRSFVTYLPQNPYIFSGSVLENIAMGSEGKVTIEAVENAAKIAEVHEDIESLPDGYFTRLSEDSGLSGGQMQRIAIARAILGESKIIILDESTSNLDLITEKRVIDNLMHMKEKTLIFIAHRLEAARRADNVIVMGNGKVLEQGTHQELLQQRGAYYKLIEE